MARIGVFICHCGENIGATVDCAAVAKAAGELPGVVHAIDYKYMCSDPGQTLIKDAIREKKLTGVISGPLNKEAFHRAGYPYLDELAYLENLTQSPEAFTIGVMDSIWTLAVTSHIPFKEIADRIRKERVFRHILLIDQAMRRTGITNRKIAVAALNVHGGEGGVIGREEIDEIRPAIEEARRMNIRVEGPFPADTVFVRALAGEFNAVVCMYHDQANMARKLSARRRGSTIFMGLPVPCGTTAHGTAFDIAGKGIADPGSLEDAIRYTAMLSSLTDLSHEVDL